ncbi:MAG: methyl-accepting chemotaxis protein, partial [Janthinobacterium sp.]
KLVALAGETMEKVVSSVQHVTDIVAEISSASAEQSAGIEQINQAIVEMDNMTQQNSALVEQASAAAQAMNEQAAGLAQIVSVFKVGAVAGVTRTAPAPAAQRRLAR